jgi:sugar lactone lactonase YvrE
MLKFIWKDWDKSGVAVAKGQQPDPKANRPTIMDVIVEGEGWQVASEGHKFTEGPAVDKDGNVFFTDQWKVWKIDANDGKVSVFVDKAEGANGSMFGPDGRLYVVLGGNKTKPGSIVAYSPDGKAETIAEDVNGNDLCVTARGAVYVTEPDRKQITYLSPEKHEKKSWPCKNIGYANGITLTPDAGQLVVADTQTPNMYAYRIEADGSLSHEQPYYIAHVPVGQPGSGADGVRVDTNGRVYAATKLGVQVFDQAGRVTGIMTNPQQKWLANLVFGGPKFDTLFVCSTDKIYKRKVKVTGSNNWQPPTAPEKPRL